MAELLLNAPTQGQQLIVPVTDTTTSINFDFDIADALFERVDDNLEVYLEESDSTLVLEDFYASFSSENIPDFLVADGQVSGEDFFAALDSSLMPAAGPAAAPAIANDGMRFGAANGDQLADGISALGNTNGGSAYGRQNFQGDFGQDGLAAPLAAVATPEADTNDVPTLLIHTSEHQTYDSTHSPDDKNEDNDNNPRSVSGSFEVGNIVDGDGGSVTITHPNGESVSFDALTGAPLGDNFITTDYGKFTINYNNTTGNFEFTYVQTKAQDHSAGDLKDEFSISVSDNDGNTSLADTATGTITIDIIDDAPSISSTLTSATKGTYTDNADLADGTDVPGNASVESGGTVSGKLNFDTSDDGTSIKVNNVEVKMSGETIVSGQEISIEGGIIKFGNNGEYTFIPNDVTSSTEITLEFVISDTDGDTETVKEVITVNPAVLPTIDAGNVEEVEGSVTTASQELDIDFNNYEGKSGSITIGEGSSTIIINFDENGLPSFADSSKTTVDGKYGTLNFTINGNKITYTYTTDPSVKHDASGLDGLSASEDFTITATGNDNDTQTGSITATVKDTVPTVESGFENVLLDVQAGKESTEYNASDYFNEGADTTNGEYTILDINGNKPSITDNNDGTVTYEYSKSAHDWVQIVVNTETGAYKIITGSSASNTDFVIQYEDGDGDKASVNVKDSFTGPVFSLRTHDDALTNGNLEEGERQPVSDTQSFSFIVSAGLQKINFSTTVDGVKSEYSIDETGQIYNEAGDKVDFISGKHGNLTFEVIETADGHYTVKYTYTQTSAVEHSAPDGINDGVENDSNNFKWNGDIFNIDSIVSGDVDNPKNFVPDGNNQIIVNIEDDEPVVTTASNNTTPEIDDDPSTTTAEMTDDGYAKALITFNHGADAVGSTIVIAEGATVKLGVEWDGTTWKPISGGSFADGVVVEGNAQSGFTIKLGDVTYTQQIDSNGKATNTWEVSYEASGRSDVETIFTDGDGDEVSHTVKGVVKVEINVDEAHLQNGTNHDASELIYEGSLAYTGFPTSIEVDGTIFTKNSSGIWTGTANVANGTVTILDVVQNGSDYIVKYQYTLTSPVDDNEANANTSPSFDMVINGTNGSLSSEVTVNIADDTPVDVPNITTSTSTDTAATFVNIDFGADDGEGKELKIGDDVFTFENGKWTDSSDNVLTDDKGNTTLTTSDGTVFKNYNDNDTWTVEVKVEDGKDTNVKVEVKDADGDVEDFTITASKSTEESADKIIGLAGTTNVIEPGENYNIAIMLDTSGSMFHDYHGDIKGEDTRLEQAVTAIRNLIFGVEDNPDTAENEGYTGLVDHAKAGLVGGKVNIFLTTFWGNTQGGTEGKDGYKVYLEIDTEKLISDPDYINKQLDLILTNNQDADGNFLEGYSSSNADAGFHWGTSYKNGFDQASDWFDTVSNSDYNNVAFLLTDGNPNDNYTNREKAFEQLEESMESGKSSNIHAVGMGAGAKESILDGYDSDKDATIVLDENINKIFSPEAGNPSSSVKTNVGITEDSKDVLLGDTDLEKLREYLAKEINVEPSAISDSMLIEYVRNYQDLIAEDKIDIFADASDDDGDALVGGANNDLIFGQGGDDLLIGDGDYISLHEIAKALQDADGTINGNTEITADDFKYDNLVPEKDDNQDNFAAEVKVKINNLVESVRDENGLVDNEQLTKLMLVSDSLEKESDGNDDIIGGIGNDILLGLGGNDSLYGGLGDDIIIGGSGNDTINGGAGNDILSGGLGEDIFIFDENSFEKGGVDTIVDFEEGDKIDLTAFEGKGYFVEVKNDSIIIKTDENATNSEDMFTIVVQNQNAGLTLDKNDFNFDDEIKI